jgi:hypothetical protein
VSKTAFKVAEGFVSVEGRLDEPSFRRAAERAGRSGGDRFATAFGLASSRRFRRMTRLFMEPINAVSGALGALRGPSLRAGILSAVLGLLPSLGKAASAIGAGLIPAMTSLASVIGVVRLMLGKLHEDVKGQTLKLLNAMAGEMRELAREAAKPGLNKLLEGVVKNGPLFERYIQRIAKAVGDALGEVGALLGDSGFVNKLNSLLEQVAESTAVWTRSLDDVVEMLVTLGDAAGPIFHDMAQRVNTLTDRWRDWLNLKYETGELQEFLQDAAEELNRWGRIFNNVIIGLYNIFAAGVGPSSRFAENLERITGSFREWTTQAANVEKVRRVFQWMVDHVDDFFRVAAAATAIGLALKGVAAAVSVVSFAQMAASLGPWGVAAAAVGAALAAIAAGMFLVYTRSAEFREQVSESFAVVREAVKENEGGLRELWSAIVAIAPAFVTAAKIGVVALAGLIDSLIMAAGWVGRVTGAIRKIPVGWQTRYLFLANPALILAVRHAVRVIPWAWRTVYRFLPGGAIAAIGRVIGAISRIPRNVTTTVTSVTRNITESIVRFANPFARATGGLIGAQGMQAGGISGGRSVLVGEQGPEMVRLPFGSKVTPAGQTRAALAGGAQQGGGQPIELNVYIGGQRVAEALINPFRKAIRTRGGDVQVVLGR